MHKIEKASFGSIFVHIFPGHVLEPADGVLEVAASLGSVSACCPSTTLGATCCNCFDDGISTLISSEGGTPSVTFLVIQLSPAQAKRLSRDFGGHAGEPPTPSHLLQHLSLLVTLAPTHQAGLDLEVKLDTCIRVALSRRDSTFSGAEDAPS